MSEHRINRIEPIQSDKGTGKHTCMRCGWRWTRRPNSPDPPHACARCRSAWQSSPISSRANFPTNPKWQAERESVARRKRERHLARLKSCRGAASRRVVPGLVSTSPLHPSWPRPGPEDLWSKSCVAA